MQKELLPCPFCGGSAAHYCNDDKRPVHYVACTSCGVEGIGRSNDKYAAEEWNTRAIAQPDYKQSTASLAHQLGLSNGRERALVTALQEVRTSLVKLAAAMVRGDNQPSRYFEDLKFCKSTPRKDRKAHWDDNRKNNDITHTRGMELTALTTKIKGVLKSVGVP